jgi:hypothetical protein
MVQFGESGQAPAAAPAAQPGKNQPYALIHPQVTNEELAGIPSNRQAALIDQRKADAEISEGASKNIINSLARYTDPTLITPYQQHLQAARDLIEKNPTAAAKVFDVMGTGDFTSQILKAAQEGGGFHTGIFSGQINLPAAAWKEAGRDPAMASYANDLATHLLASNSLKNRLSNVSTANPPVAEFQALQNATANMHQRWDSALNTIKGDMLDARFIPLLHNAYIKDLSNVDRTHEMAPFTSVIQNSKNAADVKQAWDAAKSKLLQNRTDALNAATNKTPQP